MPETFHCVSSQAKSILADEVVTTCTSVCLVLILTSARRLAIRLSSLVIFHHKASTHVLGLLLNEDRTVAAIASCTSLFIRLLDLAFNATLYRLMTAFVT
jgi:hypothetical protein